MVSNYQRFTNSQNIIRLCFHSATTCEMVSRPFVWIDIFSLPYRFMTRCMNDGYFHIKNHGYFLFAPQAPLPYIQRISNASLHVCANHFRVAIADRVTSSQFNDITAPQGALGQHPTKGKLLIVCFWLASDSPAWIGWRHKKMQMRFGKISLHFSGYSFTPHESASTHASCDY